ncbi:MAG: hypothetical protein ACPGMR_09745 [Pontibacterium sp.]
MMPTSKTLLIVINLLVLALCIAVLAYIVPRLLTPHITQAAVALEMRPGCDLATTTCVADDPKHHPNIAVDMNIEAPMLVSMAPLTFFVTLKGVDADRVTLSLDGKDMFMGVNSMEMTPVEGKENLWRAKTDLGVCVERTMTWFAKVTTYSDETETLVATFSFEASH